MEISLFQSNKNIINLIIKDHVIRLIELKSTAPLTVKRLEERFLPLNIIKDGKIVDATKLKQIINELVKKWGLKNKQIRFTVPDAYVITRKVSIPSTVLDDEIVGHLYLELGASIHLPFDDPVFDVHILSRDEEKTEVILFASPEDMVMEYASLLEENKMVPIAADISPLCLYRFYHHFGNVNEGDNLLFIQFDLSSITLSIFKDNVPLFVRTVNLTQETKVWEVTRTNSSIEWTGDIVQFNVFLEDFITEIQRVMNFFRYSLNQGDQEVNKLVLFGDHPNLPLVESKLTERINATISTVENEVKTQDQEVVDARYYYGLGLALKEV
ncbi:MULTISPECIES: type IV pilus biogenesis protein PilM [Bacillus]|uniref:type IV pilus biogenesis protein PilM n=1 Tax=Bacillus TaxID=1386 RepID=UPI000BB9088A|nr:MULTISPECIES: pilus assembly protein PilM [Bacillus]